MTATTILPSLMMMRNSSLPTPQLQSQPNAVDGAVVVEERLPPPVILQRQASEVSAWNMSEVDSHYHSDLEEEEEEEEEETIVVKNESAAAPSSNSNSLVARSIPRGISAGPGAGYADGDEDEEDLTHFTSSRMDDSMSRRSLALSEVDSHAMSQYHAYDVAGDAPFAAGQEAEGEDKVAKPAASATISTTLHNVGGRPISPPVMVFPGSFLSQNSTTNRISPTTAMGTSTPSTFLTVTPSASTITTGTAATAAARHALQLQASRAATIPQPELSGSGTQPLSLSARQEYMVTHHLHGDHHINLGVITATAASSDTTVSSDNNLSTASVDGSRAAALISPASVASTPPPHRRNHHHHQQQQQKQKQSGGDDTSEARSTPPRHYFVDDQRKPASAHAGTENQQQQQQQAFLVQVMQQRLAQSEERATTLSQRLAEEERLYRRVNDELREAHWETSNLKDQLQKQLAKVEELERQQRITDAWNKASQDLIASTEILPNVASVETLESLAASNETEHQLHLARLTSEQEQAKRQTFELIRDLKRSQDKLLKVEHQKLELLQEMNTLKASQHELASLSTANAQRQEAKIHQLIKAEQALKTELLETNTKVEQLREAKSQLETMLQDAIQREGGLKNLLAKQRVELETLQSTHATLEAEHANLTKKVRFADEQIESFQQSQSDLQANLVRVQEESQRTVQFWEDKYEVLETSHKVLESEKNDLYASLQKALDDHRQTQTKVVELEASHQATREELEEVQTKLQDTQTEHEQAQMSWEASLVEKEALLKQERHEAATFQAKLQDELNSTQSKVQELESTLTESQKSLRELTEEKQRLLLSQTTLQSQLETSRQRAEFLEKEGAALKNSLELLQEEHVSSKASSKAQEDKFEAELQAAQEATEVLLAKSVEEQAMLEVQFLNEQSKLSQLETQHEALQTAQSELLEEKKGLLAKITQLEEALVSQKQTLEADFSVKLQSMEEKYSLLKSTVQVLQSRQATLEQQLSASEELVCTLEGNVEEAIATKGPLEKKVSVANERVLQLEQNLEDSKTKLQTLQVDHSALQVEYQTLREEYKKANSEVASLLVANEDAADVVQSLEETRSQLSAELKNLQDKHADLEMHFAKSQIDKDGKGSPDAKIMYTEEQHSRDVASSSRSLHLQADAQAFVQLQAALQEVQSKHDKANVDLAKAQSLAKEQEELLESALDTKTQLSQQLKTLSGELHDRSMKLDDAEARLEVLSAEKENLEGIRAQLEGKLQAAEGDLTQIRKEKEILVKENASLREENAAVQEALDTTKEESARLQYDLQHARQQLHDLQDKSKQTEEETGALRSIGKAQEESLTKALEESKVKHEISALESKKLQSQLAETKESVQKLERSLVAAQNDSKRAKVDLQAQVQATKAFEDQVASLNAKLSILTSSRDKLDAEKKNLAEEHAKEVQDLQANVTSIQRERNGLHEDLESKRSALDQLDLEKKELEGALTATRLSFKEAQHQLLASKTELEAAQAIQASTEVRRLELEMEHNSLKETISSLEQQLQSVTAERDDVVLKYKGVSKSLESAKGLLEAVKAQRDEIESKQKEAEAETVILGKELSCVRATAETLQKDIDTLQKDKESLIALNSSLTNEKAQLLDRLESESTLLKAKISSLEAEKTFVNKTLEKAEHDNIDLLDQIASLKVDLEIATTRDHELESKITELTENNDNLAAESDSARKEASALQKDLLVTRAAIATTENRLEVAKKEVANLEKARDTALSQQREIAAKETSLQTELLSVQALVSSLEGKIASMNADRTVLVEAHQNELDEVKADKDVQIETLKDENVNLKKEADELKQKEQQLKVEIKTLMEALEDKESKSAGIETDLLRKAEEKQLRLEKLQKELEHVTQEADVKLQRTAEEKEALVKNYGELQKERGSLKAEVSSLSEQLAVLHESKENLRGQLDSLQSEKEMLVMNEAERFQGAAVKAALKLEESQAANEELRRQKTESEGKRKALESEILALGERLASAESEARSLEVKIAKVSVEKEQIEKDYLAKAEASRLAEDERLSRMEASTITLREEGKAALVNQERLEEEVKELLADLTSLKTTKAGLELKIEELTAEKDRLRDEHKRALGVSNEETNRKLKDSQAEVDVLRNEKTAAMARQATLEADVASLLGKLASYEDMSSQLQKEIDTLKEEKAELVRTRDQQQQSRSLEVPAALYSIAANSSSEVYEDEHPLEEQPRSLDFGMALGPVAKSSQLDSMQVDLIHQLQEEKSRMEQRAIAAEEAYTVLQTKSQEQAESDRAHLKKLGDQITKDHGVIKKLAKQLKLSDRERIALRRAARALVRRIRELEVVHGLGDIAVDTSNDTSVNVGRNESDLTTIAVSVVEDAEIRVRQASITLEMQYHDNEGKAKAYEIDCLYTGALVNGLASGPGVLRLENGDIYLGEFKNGEMDGVGAFAHKARESHSNMVFCGEFRKNEFQGGKAEAPPIDRVRISKILRK